MQLPLQKKSLLQKIIQVGSFTLLSRFFGIIREGLQARYLGVGAMSDAFITAFKIPNFFRKIFAEGALSASFIPEFVKLIRDNKKDAACRFLTTAFLFFEGIVLLLTFLVFFFTTPLVKLIAPGFSPEQVMLTAPYLKIVFPFLFFISSAALLAGALQSINHFIIPSAASVVLNIVYVSSLLLCHKYSLNPEYLCVGIVLGGFLNFVIHIWMYYRLGLYFAWFNKESFEHLKIMLQRFLPFLLGASIIEINLFIDTSIGSYLPKGEITLLYYAMRYAQIPLGIFSIALSTVLLPYFSRIALYAKNRFHFYLLEVSKLISWVIIPMMLFLMFTSRQIFALIMLKDRGTVEQITKAGYLLVILSSGLLIFSLHRSVINILYALKDAWTPTWTTILATTCNFIGNIIGFWYAGVYGIACSTVMSSTISLIACLYVLHTKHKIYFAFKHYLQFLYGLSAQVALGVFLFLTCFYGILMLCSKSWLHHAILHGQLYWVVTCPLFGMIMVMLFLLRKKFGITLYFVDFH
ncbi:murein biosynthesis integral membrane protein MurJ [Candidatus Babeliales bacterium]|nr:murein biosynthesis integral membrane protein MurJ [Candidatus Babeliales bacterium]